MQGEIKDSYFGYQYYWEWWEKLFDEKQYRQLVDYCLDNRSRKWLITALIDGSDGYHTYNHANILIERYKAGETHGYCERCSACYNDDLVYMLACDCHHMLYMEKTSMGYVQNHLELTEHLAERKDSEMFSMAVSMLYPSMAV